MAVNHSTPFAQLLAALVLTSCGQSVAAQPVTLPDYETEVLPVLVDYCYDCHGDGSDKGQVALDELSLTPEHQEVWHRVLRNLRAELMPPTGKPRPSQAQLDLLEQWIKYSALSINPDDPRPGSLGLRRLNRFEYQNTIRDLMGIEFRADVEFPPDDSGYGFDNIGSVLSLSPLLTEKYLEAAKVIVRDAVPLQLRVPAEQTFTGRDFLSPDKKTDGDRLPFSQPQTVSHRLELPLDGTYRLHFNTEVDGAFDYDPGRSQITFRLDGKELKSTEHAWKPSDKFADTFELECSAGEHVLEISLKPTVPTEDEDNQIYYEIHRVAIQGPMAEEHWVKPARYDRFFTRNHIPLTQKEKTNYATELIARFATKAFRHPPTDSTIQRLVTVAESTWLEPGKTFQEGIARAFVATLASPRFLLRVDQPLAASSGTSHPYIDEYSLASRLSYFLWSSMPDETLMSLAEKGALRSDLPAQIRRLLDDPKAEAFISSFVGQWLQARNVEGASINARAVLQREQKEDPEATRMRTRFFELVRKPREELTEAENTELQELRTQFRRIFRRPRAELTSSLKRAMRQESELAFRYLLEEDRSLLELIDSDYTFLNETLAKHYGIEGVEGREMRRVTLPPEHARGGVLTHGTTLVVTSNPTRTSPVKRGLFILENILGTPPPPPPADVPDLESAKTEEGHEPTLREALAIHRESPLCRSCHNRMDPLGLSLENFNAMGMWRDQERQQSIDPTGKLITGEPFQNINELKKILVTERKLDFYRCITEKMLTYALGRGLEPYDIESVDRIVNALQSEGDTVATLIKGVILSAPFQKTEAQNQQQAKDLALNP
jgi:hypothetical protein